MRVTENVSSTRFYVDMSTPLLRSLGGQVVDRLRDEILSGVYAEGDPLRERELAERFAVSRGPVRDALKQLTWEGIVVTEGYRGSRVAPRVPDEVRDLIVPLRRTIETFALRSFFDRIDEADYRRWEEILDRMEIACRREDLSGIAEQDLALHRSIIERAGFPDLGAIWTVILARIRRHFVDSYERYDSLMEIHQEHRALVETFRSGDLEASLKALQDNVQ